MADKRKLKYPTLCPLGREVPAALLAAVETFLFNNLPQQLYSTLLRIHTVSIHKILPYLSLRQYKVVPLHTHRDVVSDQTPNNCDSVGLFENPLIPYSVLPPPPRYPSQAAYNMAVANGQAAPMIETNNILSKPTGPEYQLVVGEGMPYSTSCQFLECSLIRLKEHIY